MLRSSVFDDPFFAGQREQTDQMFADPFGHMNRGMLALPQGGGRRPRQGHRPNNMQGQQVADRRHFSDPFSHFDSMFSNMRSMMTEMHRAFESQGSDPNAQVFQQSSCMTYSNTGNGAPQYYQASSSTHQGPGGVRETRRTVRDSESGLEKVSVGHHINDRGHVIERARNRKTGDANENQEYLNINEEDAPKFDQEYQEKWHSSRRGLEGRHRPDRYVGNQQRSRYAALPEAEGRHHRRPKHRE